jgi:hypothetical protein
MSTQHGFHILWRRVHQGAQSYRSYVPSLPVLSVGAITIVGAGVFLALPDASPEPSASSATAAPTQTASDESACDKQAWPYVDQRCAQRVEAARGTRQVRVVTDRGNVVTMVTPMPTVEPKPAAPKPVVAQNDRPIGPVVAPTAAEPAAQNVAIAPQPAPAPQNPPPAPKVEPVVAQPNPATPPPAATNAIAVEKPSPATTRSVSVDPPQTSPAAVAATAGALDDEMTTRKSKAAQTAEKREAKREAKRMKAPQQDDAGVPAEVVAAVKPSRGERAARSGVPAEVVAAVEEAVTSDRGNRGGRRVIVLDGESGGQVVTVGSPSAGGQRVYLVPREQAGNW